MFMKDKLHQYWSGWVRQRAIAVNPQRLSAGNLYILPSGFGIAFGVVLLTLFLCAINYQVSSVFFLTFLLAVVGMVSAWQAHFNLKGLSVNCLSIEDAHQDEAVKVVLLVTVEQRLRYVVGYHFFQQEALMLPRLDTNGTQITLYLPAKGRGCFQLPRITFYSYFPLSLFRVWGYIYFDANYYVYPSSVSPGFWPQSSIESGGGTSLRVGDEELYELKQVINPWEQSSRIAWKIAARGQGWYLKTMVSSEGNYWLFRIKDLPIANIETNLQQLCYWLQAAEKAGYFYGLELKGIRTEVSQGASHLTHCLRQLAIY